jgi:hypothetical protein
LMYLLMYPASSTESFLSVFFTDLVMR